MVRFPFFFVDASRSRAKQLINALALLQAKGSMSQKELTDISGSDKTACDICTVLELLGVARPIEDGLEDIDIFNPCLAGISAVQDFVMGTKEASSYRRFLESVNFPSHASDDKCDNEEDEPKDRRDTPQVKQFITEYIDVADIVDRQRAQEEPNED